MFALQMRYVACKAIKTNRKGRRYYCCSILDQQSLMQNYM